MRPAVQNARVGGRFGQTKFGSWSMPDQVSRRARAMSLDPDVTDYDVWRTLRSVRDEIYRLDREGSPIPIRLLYARKTLELAKRNRETID